MNQKIIKLSLPLLGIIAVAYLIFSPSRYVGYSPDQPIPFNHKIHAGDNGIDCRYCHTGVDNSAHATIPPLSTCMNCHGLGGVAAKVDNVKWLADQYNNKKPVSWIKVHDVPDFVYFNHSRHIQSGVDCSQCHGNMPETEKVSQVKSLNMGFCVDCHRENNAPNDCSTCHR